MKKAMDNEEQGLAVNAIFELIKVVARLRDPEKGCPWDLEQTHFSLIPYLLEEAHEVTDAIRHGDDNNLREELGDLLLQVVLHAQIANEDQRFSIKDIAEEITQKMIRRHPHVFSDKKVSSSEAVKKNWEGIKALEKPITNSKSPLSDRIKNKVRSQSPLSGAMHISRKAAEEGFEWESIEGVWAKVHEELDELKDAIKNKTTSDAQEELGDVLFTLVNIARWCDVNPEEGLTSTNQRFLERFSRVEASVEGKMSELPLKELEQLWEKAKKQILAEN